MAVQEVEAIELRTRVSFEMAIWDLMSPDLHINIKRPIPGN
jgi:hypothetical protein